MAIPAILKKKIGPFSVGTWSLVGVAGIGLGLLVRKGFGKGGTEEGQAVPVVGRATVSPEEIEAIAGGVAEPILKFLQQQKPAQISGGYADPTGGGTLPDLGLVPIPRVITGAQPPRPSIFTRLLAPAPKKSSTVTQKPIKAPVVRKPVARAVTSPPPQRAPVARPRTTAPPVSRGSAGRTKPPKATTKRVTPPRRRPPVKKGKGTSSGGLKPL